MMYAFNVRNKKAELVGLPQEDSFLFNPSEKSACVADLITRDFRDGSVLSRDLKGLIKIKLGMYPDYSMASDICVSAFLDTKSLAEANERIRGYNIKEDLSDSYRKIQPDYLGRDLAGCTAAGFWKDKNNEIIHWSFICDSGIAIIDSNGYLKFKTPDEGPHSREKNPYLEGIVQENGGWENPKARIAIRSQYRNNHKEKLAYGALTGEETALQYVREGAQYINSGDYVLAFTDGVGDFIFNSSSGKPEKNFLDVLSHNNTSELKGFCQDRVHSEGTLVVYGVEK